MSGPGQRPEQRPLQGNLYEDINRQDREEQARLAAALGLTVLADTDVFEEERVSDNQILLLAGDHGGMRLEMPRTAIQGQPGARITRLVRVNDDATFTGITFVSDGAAANNAAVLVQVLSATAVVKFINCTFTKHASNTTTCVTLVAGAGASFTGCTFRGGDGATGNPITNAGVAADCGVVGGRNSTGRIHTNSTILFEM